ncbi:MAG: hypothetical protein AAB514_02680 [Patescibacteria group bacterium]
MDDETRVLANSQRMNFLQPARGFASENCLEEHPAAPTGLVSDECRTRRGEGEENFVAGTKLFCF